MPAERDDEKRKPSDKLLAILAKNIRALRKLRGLSQEKLGEKCGYHPTFVSMVERKQRNVTVSTLELFAEALGVETYQLLMDKDSSEGNAKTLSGTSVAKKPRTKATRDA